MRGHLRRLITSRFKRAAAIAVLTCLGATAALAQATGEPATIGVSGPLTGQNAQYGAQWKKGFDLALEEVNKTGVKGRPLQYVFEDSQADPRQTVAIAQKFVSDPKIVVELGDFSSTASMAASLSARRPRAVRLYQFAPKIHPGRRLHLEQFGEPGRRAAAPRQICRRSGLQASRGALSQHRLGTSEPEPVRRGRKAQRRRDRRRGRLPAGREGFPFDAGPCARRQA